MNRKLKEMSLQKATEPVVTISLVILTIFLICLLILSLGFGPNDNSQLLFNLAVSTVALTCIVGTYNFARHRRRAWVFSAVLYIFCLGVVVSFPVGFAQGVVATLSIYPAPVLFVAAALGIVGLVAQITTLIKPK